MKFSQIVDDLLTSLQQQVARIESLNGGATKFSTLPLQKLLAVVLYICVSKTIDDVETNSFST